MGLYATLARFSQSIAKHTRLVLRLVDDGVEHALYHVEVALNMFPCTTCELVAAVG